METKEFRLGNFAQDQFGNLLKVDELSSEKIAFKTEKGLADGWQAEPIPLTEEWLLKFGLEKVEENLYQEDGNYLVGFFAKKWFIGKQNFDNDIGMIKDFESVHQLQNLYFALTESELELKK